MLIYLTGIKLVGGGQKRVVIFNFISCADVVVVPCIHACGAVNK